MIDVQFNCLCYMVIIEIIKLYSDKGFLLSIRSQSYVFNTHTHTHTHIYTPQGGIILAKEYNGCHTRNAKVF